MPARLIPLLALCILLVLTLPAGAQPAEPVPDLQLLLRGADAWQKAPPELKQQVIEQFRARLPEVRQQVTEGVYEKIKEKRAAAWEPIGDLVALFILGGPLLLLLPFFVVRRYPGQFFKLCRYSALSAVLFSATVALFYVPLLILGEIWEELAIGVDPRLRALNAIFDLLDSNAADFLSRELPLQVTLQQMADGSPDSFLTVLLDNLAKVEAQLEGFQPLVDLYRRLDWVFGALPKVQCLLFAVLFVVPLYPIFREIVTLPLHAAAGEPGEGKRVAKLALRNWLREVGALLVLLGVFVLIAIVNDLVLTTVAGPATATMLNFLFVALDYLGSEPNPSLGLLDFALGTVAFFYLFNILAMTAAIIFYLQAALRILRLRFQQKVPLRADAAFWIWGTLALLWAQLLPVLFIFLALPVIQGVLWAYAEANPPAYLGGLVTSGALLLFGFGLVYWLARGFRALRYLFRYSVPLAKADVA